MNLNKFQEKRKHGNYMLPLGVYDVCLGEHEKYISAHWHNEFEIVFILSGEFTLNINSNTFTCCKDDILLINKEELHSFNIDDNGECFWKTLVFDLSQLNSTIFDSCSVNFIAPIINKEFKFPSIISANSNSNIEIRAILESIINCYNSKSYGFELEIKSLMFHFFSYLFKNELVNKIDKHSCNEAKVDKIKTVLSYIEKNYNKEISIDELADMCHYNKYHFMRFFKKHTGKTCTQFIKDYRLDKAVKLLSSTDLAITQIALDVGFSNISYFIRSFKEKNMITPNEFKKNL